MKHCCLPLLFMVIALLTKGQSISPNFTGEFCPNTDISFIVTLPGTNTNFSLSVAGGCQVVGGPDNIVSANGTTTFKFKGRFADINQEQDFKISYGNSQLFVATFKNIKSLFYTNDFKCGEIKPTTPFLQPPLCQV